MKILVTGHKGMLGSDLLPRLENAGLDIKGVDIDDLNITQLDSIIQYFEALCPEQARKSDDE